MHPRIITRFVAILILFLGISMALPLLVSLIYDDGSTTGFTLFHAYLILCWAHFLPLNKGKRKSPL